jgi:predicted permease
MVEDHLDLDVLKEQWADNDRKLEASLRLNLQMLREMYTTRARHALWRLAAMLTAGSFFWLAVIISLGTFMARCGWTPRFLWPAVVLDIFAIAALIGLNAQIGLALNINYDQPIVEIQRRLEKLRMFRLRYTQGICLTMTLTWAPIVIVLLKGLFGMDAYRLFGTSWILWNVLFGLALGLALVALWIWLSKKYGSRIGGSAFGRRFMRDIGGYNLNAAADFLATLAKFQDENGNG